MNRYTYLWRELDRKLPDLYDWNENLSPHQLIYGIGLVAHEFEFVHQAILQMFSVLCGSRDRQPNFKLSEILAPAASFSMKVKLCKEAAEQFEDDPHRKDAIKRWLDLAERASERRNDIIHGRVINQQTGDHMQTLLLPATFDRRRGGFMTSSVKPLYAYTPEQVQVYADAIRRIAGNLFTLMVGLANHPVEPEDEWMLHPEELNR